ncbi:MAG: hypothetical protein ACD_62C00400G0004 [uncultured bacterium]|nr:MAG: hypothetical protein ACD_62C00400G0004 [uncultured bacterium]
MTLDRQILLNILALDKGFEEFEFIHSYLGPPIIRKLSAKIPVKMAYENLHTLRELVRSDFDDEPPFYRATYVDDLIQSVLAQTEYFVLGVRSDSTKSLAERFLGFETLPPYDLGEELRVLREGLDDYGYGSVGEYRKARQLLTFASPQQLSRYVHRLCDELSLRIKNRLAPLFHFDMAPLLNRSQLRVTATKKDDPPCFYRYLGDFHGMVGLSVKKNYFRDYLENFITHEILPGHHFYYLVKQQYLNSGTGDALMAIDTYYSPENLINEGLAVNSDLLFGEAWDARTSCTLAIDKYLHKIYHNAWHALNVSCGRPDPLCQDILESEFGLSRVEALTRLNYFTQEARWYTPSYSQGIHHVGHFINACGRALVPLLYGQHSVNTLKKLENYHEHTHAA